MPRLRNRAAAKKPEESVGRQMIRQALQSPATPQQPVPLRSSSKNWSAKAQGKKMVIKKIRVTIVRGNCSDIDVDLVCEPENLTPVQRALYNQKAKAWRAYQDQIKSYTAKGAKIVYKDQPGGADDPIELDDEDDVIIVDDADPKTKGKAGRGARAKKGTAAPAQASGKDAAAAAVAAAAAAAQTTAATKSARRGRHKRDSQPSPATANGQEPVVPMVTPVAVVPSAVPVALSRVESPSKNKPTSKRKLQRNPKVLEAAAKAVYTVPLGEYYYGRALGDPSYYDVRGQFRFKCVVCSKFLSSNVRLTCHLMGHVNANVNLASDLPHLLVCYLCHDKFDTPFDKQQHMEKVHQDVTSASVCRICDKNFDNTPALVQHMREKHTCQEMPYWCKLCHFRSSFHSDVIEHFNKKHKRSRHVLCEYCLKVIKTSAAHSRLGTSNGFYQHLLKHQIKAQVKKCCQCKLQFVNSRELDLHRQTNHNSCRASQIVRGMLLAPAALEKKTTEPVKLLLDTDVAGQSGTQPRTEVLHSVYNKDGLAVEKKDYTCLECQLPLKRYSTDHFPEWAECPICAFSTCCGTAFRTHMETVHKAVCSLPRPAPAPAKRLRQGVALEHAATCVCGDLFTDGDKLARHLVACQEASVYIGAARDVMSPLPDDAEDQHTETDEDSQNNPLAFMKLLGLRRKQTARRGAGRPKMSPMKEGAAAPVLGPSTPDTFNSDSCDSSTFPFRPTNDSADVSPERPITDMEDSQEPISVDPVEGDWTVTEKGEDSSDGSVRQEDTDSGKGSEDIVEDERGEANVRKDSAEIIYGETAEQGASVVSEKPVGDEEENERVEKDSEKPVGDKEETEKVEKDSEKPVGDKEETEKVEKDSEKPVGDKEETEKVEKDSEKPVADKEETEKVEKDSDTLEPERRDQLTDDEAKDTSTAKSNSKEAEEKETSEQVEEGENAGQKDADTEEPVVKKIQDPEIRAEEKDTMDDTSKTCENKDEVVTGESEKNQEKNADDSEDLRAGVEETQAIETGNSGEGENMEVESVPEQESEGKNVDTKQPETREASTAHSEPQVAVPDESPEAGNEAEVQEKDDMSAGEKEGGDGASEKQVVSKDKEGSRDAVAEAEKPAHDGPQELEAIAADETTGVPAKEELQLTTSTETAALDSTAAKADQEVVEPSESEPQTLPNPPEEMETEVSEPSAVAQEFDARKEDAGSAPQDTTEQGPSTADVESMQTE